MMIGNRINAMRGENYHFQRTNLSISNIHSYVRAECNADDATRSQPLSESLRNVTYFPDQREDNWSEFAIITHMLQMYAQRFLRANVLFFVRLKCKKALKRKKRPPTLTRQI